jgi:hypothetical protein
MTTFTVRNKRTGQLMSLQCSGVKMEDDIRDHLSRTSPELEFVSVGGIDQPVVTPVAGKIENHAKAE